MTASVAATAAEFGPDLAAAVAATRARGPVALPPELLQAAGAMTPAQVTPELIEGADLILTATRELRSQVLSEAPGALRRTFTMLEFAALASMSDVASGGSPSEVVKWAGAHRSAAAAVEQDVPDPFRRGAEVHAAAAAAIHGAVEEIAKGLSR